MNRNGIQIKFNWIESDVSMDHFMRVNSMDMTQIESNTFDIFSIGKCFDLHFIIGFTLVDFVTNKTAETHVHMVNL